MCDLFEGSGYPRPGAHVCGLYSLEMGLYLTLELRLQELSDVLHPRLLLIIVSLDIPAQRLYLVRRLFLISRSRA